MNRVLSLAHLSAIDLHPWELIRLAAETGYQAVGLRLIAVTPDTPAYSLMHDPPGLRETRAAMAETGVEVLDVEFFRLAPQIDPGSYLSALEIAATLGARNLLVAAYDPDEARLADRLAQLAALAAPLDLAVNLEFYPWTGVANLADARRIVHASGALNAGVLVDALHLARSDTTLAELRAASADFRYLHLCDAPVGHPGSLEGLLHAARAERLVPGEGGLDLAGFLRAMPREIPVALEVPMTARMQKHGPRPGVEACVRAARALLARLD